MTEFLQSNFSKDPDGDIIILKILKVSRILLEPSAITILSVKQLPEEAVNDHVVIDEQLREEYIRFLREKVEPDVLLILDNFAGLKSQMSMTMKYEVSKPWVTQC